MCNIYPLSFYFLLYLSTQDVFCILMMFWSSQIGHTHLWKFLKRVHLLFIWSSSLYFQPMFVISDTLRDTAVPPSWWGSLTSMTTSRCSSRMRSVCPSRRTRSNERFTRWSPKTWTLGTMPGCLTQSLVRIMLRIMQKSNTVIDSLLSLCV